MIKSAEGAFGALLVLSTLGAARPWSQQQKAVQAAEEYIGIHGYTSAAPDPRAVSDEEPILVKTRRDSLCPKAYGVVIGSKGEGFGIAFKYRSKYLKRHGLVSERNNIGLLVHVDLDARNLRAQHSDVRLKEVDRILPGGDCEAGRQ